MDLQSALLARRVGAYYEEVDRMAELLDELEGRELDHDEAEQLAGEIAPLLDEMRTLLDAGVIELAAEAKRELTTHYAYLTAHGTGWQDN